MSAAPQSAERGPGDTAPGPPGRPSALELLVVGLARYEAAGAVGLAEVCRAHPDQAPELLRRLRRLAELGLLPDPGGPEDPGRTAPAAPAAPAGPVCRGPGAPSAGPGEASHEPGQGT